MCGILGVIGNPKIDIKRSLESIAHRGPDDEGIFKDDYVSFGFRRLSIIDLSSHGHQPMSDKNGKIWIVFNGEVYNHAELRKELSSSYSFNSQTDTEVLIYGYMKWGIEGLLKRINGMFAFALYDKKKKQVFIARDRIGKKPIYLYTSKDYFAFSSETKAFFYLPNFKFSLKKDAFEEWMGFPYFANNSHTLLNNVSKVRPGHFVTISQNTVEETMYWDLGDDKSVKKLNLKEAKETLENLLIDSVKKRLIADVPVGILLSGGLDSSLITALTSKYSKKKVKVVNISFKNSNIDESKYAEMVASHCKTDLIKLQLDINDTYEIFKKNIWIFDDLSTIDGGLFSTFLLSQEIKSLGVKVVLVGEGADEVFGGYTWFQISKLPLSILPYRLKVLMYYYAIMRIFKNSKFSKYAGELRKHLEQFDGDFFRKIQSNEIKYSLPNHYCMKLDKGASAASIEARAPFLDHRIVQFAHNLKSRYLVKGSWYSRASNEKFILREIAKDYLPDQIFRRKKKGGMLPIDEILTVGLEKDKALILSNKQLTNFFGKEWLNELIDSKPTNRIVKWQREWILWKCLVFALWSDYYGKVR